MHRLFAKLAGRSLNQALLLALVEIEDGYLHIHGVLGSLDFLLLLLARQFLLFLLDLLYLGLLGGE